MSAAAIDEPVHTSVLLQDIIARAPPDSFTLEWLIANLPKHSYGFIFLFLSLVALLPIISVVARVLIVVLTIQILLHYHSPVLPRRWMGRPIPSRYLGYLQRYAVPALQHLEMLVRPRWPVVLTHARYLTAFIVMISMALSIPLPLPLANMMPAALGALMALAYIEHDGLMLFLALVTAILLLAVTLVFILLPFV